jgi:hypothetical protein
MDWQARFAALAELDDSEGEWEAEHERIEQEWRQAYRAAFIEIAVARGWREEDAATWPSEIGADAFTECYLYDHSPRKTAEADVIACEEPP